MNEIQNISLPIIIEIDEDNFYIVSCPFFKGCHSYGKTVDEAIENIKEVIEICLDELNVSYNSVNKYIGVREINFSRQNKLVYA